AARSFWLSSWLRGYGRSAPGAGSRGGLPTVVGERLVGVGHLVAVFAPLHGSAAVLRRVEHLVGEALAHGLLRAGPCGLDDPAVGQGLATLGAHLDRNLVVGAAHAASRSEERRVGN